MANVTDIHNIIGEHPFFQGMSEEHIRLLAGCARNVRFEKDRFIFREGEDANLFYCIRAGRVALEFHTPNRGVVQFDDRRVGEVLGWSWLVAPYTWYCDAHATEDVRAIAFDGACLRGKLQADLELGFQIYERFTMLMYRNLQATRLQLIDVYGTD